MNKNKLLKAITVDITVNAGDPEDFKILAEALKKGYIVESGKYVYSLTELGKNLK